MVRPSFDSLQAAQRDRLRRFGAAESVDVHCHCLAGLDDGPATRDEALRLCRGLVADGVTTAVAAVHQLGCYDGANDPDTVRRAVTDLNAALIAEAIPLLVAPGAEIRLDERIPSLLDRDGVLGLGRSGRYVLIEMPRRAFIDPLPLFDVLLAYGRVPLIAHPERCDALWRAPSRALEWVEAGAVLQITATSLAGQLGRPIEALAWSWLMTGAPAVVASDAHDVELRPPRMAAAIERVAGRLGEPAARCLCIENPLRVLDGHDCVATPVGVPATVAVPALA